MLGLTKGRVTLIVLIAAVIFVGAQYLPPSFSALQFNDFIRQQVKFAGSSRKTTEDVIQDVMSKAKELRIPIQEKDIRITKRGPSFTLDLDYRFPIDLRVYQHDLTFHVSETGESFER